MKGLNVYLHLATSHMGLLGAFFQSIMDHAKIKKGYFSAYQGGSKKARHFGVFKSQTSRGRDFSGFCCY